MYFNHLLSCNNYSSHATTAQQFKKKRQSNNTRHLVKSIKPGVLLPNDLHYSKQAMFSLPQTHPISDRQ